MGDEKYPGMEHVEFDGHTYYIETTNSGPMPHLPHVGVQVEKMRKEDFYRDSEEAKGDAEMPGKVDEGLWDRAKKAARKQYPDWADDNPRFWKVVSSTYKKLGGKFSKQVEKSIETIETIETVTPNFIEDPRIWVAALQKAGITGMTQPIDLLALHERIGKNFGAVFGHYADMGGKLQKSSALDERTPPEETIEKGEHGVHKYLTKVPRPGGGFRYLYNASSGTEPVTDPHAAKPQVTPSKSKEQEPPSKKPTDLARVIAKLDKRKANQQKAALRNVTYENLKILDTHAKERKAESLRKVIREELAHKKVEFERQRQASKQKTKQEDQYKSFADDRREEVTKSLAAAHPKWDKPTLRGFAEAQLRQLYRLRR